MTGRLQNEVAIVIGAGIREAIVRKLAKGGAKVVVRGLPIDFLRDVAVASYPCCDGAIANAIQLISDAKRVKVSPLSPQQEPLCS